MKINRKDLKWFMKNIRYHSDGKDVSQNIWKIVKPEFKKL